MSGNRSGGWEGPGKLLGFILGENKRRKVGVGEGTGVAAFQEIPRVL